MSRVSHFESSGDVEGVSRAEAARAGRLWGVWAVLVGGFGLLYGLTAARTIQWQDSGHYVLRVVSGQWENEYGLALVHPLHYWLGVAAVAVLPVAAPWACSLVSAVFGAVTAANVYGIVHTLRRGVAAGLLAAVSLGLGHTFWRQSTIPESYTITTALLTAELWCLLLLVRTGRGRWALGMSLANGLGWANHNLALLTLPIVVFFVLRACWARGGRRGWGLAGGAAFVWLAGASPYWGLIVHEMARTGQFGAVIYSALFGDQFSDQVLNVLPPLAYLTASVAFTGLSFANLFLPLAAYGLWRVRKGGGADRLFLLAAVAGLLVHALFVLRYGVIDQYTFLLPTYSLLAIFAGFGLSELHARRASLARGVSLAMVVLLALGPLVYAATPALARQVEALGPFYRDKPYRDDYRYLFWPWMAADRSADRMSGHALELAWPDGIIVWEDRMGLFALAYQRHEAEAWEVQLQPELSEADAEAALDASRPVVLAPRHVAQPQIEAKAGRWERVGDLYVLRGD